MDGLNTVENHSAENNCLVSTPKSSDSKNATLRRLCKPLTPHPTFHTRTPFSKCGKVHSSFKSPLQVTESTKRSPEEEVEELQRQEEQLDTEITQLEAEGYRVEELERHIDMLHEYNDIKDIGQTLLGRIAALRGTTTRDLYSHFDLELDD